jgi:hypothetical protein
VTENPVTSWDDYPVHQTSEFIRHVGTSDRNFYDRYYFNFFDKAGEVMGLLGLGQYPNLGVTDAFVSVRVGPDQHVVRASRPLTDRGDTSIGPLRVEVIEPLKKLRIIVEPTEHTVALDLTWDGTGPAVAEPGQFVRQRGRVIYDTQRLAQLGTWTGTVTVGGADHVATADGWLGSRDRSWGVRPVGEKEPEGIQVGMSPTIGMWNYFPIRFADHCIFYINNERADGERVLEQSERVWDDGRIEELGRAEHAHELHPGTRLVSKAVVSFPEAGIEITGTPLQTNFLAVGSGYGLEPNWRHGMYQGTELVVQGEVYPVADMPDYAKGIGDHSGRFTYDGNEGYGLIEQGFSGPFPKYGLS